MLKSFIAFHVNGVSNFLYLITNNIGMVIMFVAFLGMVLLYLLCEIENATSEEQVII